MVTHTTSTAGRRRGYLRPARTVIACAALVAGCASAPRTAAADDILERMQQEISAIVRNAKGAVVTIEDSAPRTATGKVNLDLEKLLAESTNLVAHVGSLSPQFAGKDDKEERRAARAEAAKEIAANRERIREAQKLAQEHIEKALRVVALPKSGSGFCIGDGYVVTSADVLEGMKQPIVITDGGDRIKATVIGTDATFNVGLLRVSDGGSIPALRWGDSNRVCVGCFGISIGNQSGQMNSTSLNLIAGVRSMSTPAGDHFYPSLIQIAGTVGAGSSGAPLLNARGEVIGMMAAVQAGDWTENRVMMPKGNRTFEIPDRPGVGGAESRARKPAPSEEDPLDEPSASFTFLRPPVTSAGFAVPSNDVRRIIDDLRAGKRIVRGWLGIYPKEEERIVRKGALTRTVTEVRVEKVYADSPASRAGVQAGDIVMSLNGAQTSCNGCVQAVSLRLRPGDVVAMVVKRGSGLQTLSLKIDARPTVSVAPTPRPAKQPQPERKSELKQPIKQEAPSPPKDLGTNNRKVDKCDS